MLLLIGYYSLIKYFLRILYNKINIKITSGDLMRTKRIHIEIYLNQSSTLEIKFAL